MTGHGFSLAYLTSLCCSYFDLWSWLYLFLSGGTASTYYDNIYIAGALSVDFTIRLSRLPKYRWLRSNTLLRLRHRYWHVIFRSKATAIFPPVSKKFLAPVPSLLTKRYDYLCCLKQWWWRNNTFLRLGLRYRYVVIHFEAARMSPLVTNVFPGWVICPLSLTYDFRSYRNNAGGGSTRSCALVSAVDAIIFLHWPHQWLAKPE
jgi:hypothetical protein